MAPFAAIQALGTWSALAGGGYLGVLVKLTKTTKTA